MKDKAETTQSSSNVIGTDSSSNLLNTTSAGIDFTTSISGIDQFSGSDIKLISFDFKETSDGNFIEVVKRQELSINITYTIYCPPQNSARVWKEIYGIFKDENGVSKLQLIRTIEGKITPAYSVEEEIDFEE